MQPAQLLVGLGNPGPEYEKTRHNVGFMMVERLADRFHAKPWQKKFKGLCAPLEIEGVSCLLLKPMTFMNLSGECVGEAARFFKLKPEMITIFHDDMDLALGQVKFKQGGGAAGHNGLKSIDAHVGNDTWRVRLGIGHPQNRDQVVDYVIGSFSKADRACMEELMEKIGDSADLFLSRDASRFMQRMKV
jgi:PTH1 family peptidyl-tRNA hydrolase